MLTKIRNTAITAATIGAVGLGGAAYAGAADKPAGTAAKSQKQELSADVAAKVKAAALAKVPGATVVRTEAGGPYNAAYHAHIKTSSGTAQVVLVNDEFEATAVQADNGRGGGKGRGRHGNETPLTGDTKSKVEAAVLAKYPGATIVRSETNDGDADAPYEAHITTKDGKQLEVTVSKDFQVVGVNERPARP